MKQFILLMIFPFALYAGENTLLIGQWKSVTNSVNNGTHTTEEENLFLNADSTFRSVFFVSIQKGTAYVKNLRIEGQGLWKSRKNVLVLVVKHVKVPVAGEVYGVSGDSLEKIAATFHDSFRDDPVRILFIRELSKQKLVTENSHKLFIEYNRQP